MQHPYEMQVSSSKIITRPGSLGSNPWVPNINIDCSSLKYLFYHYKSLYKLYLILQQIGIQLKYGCK